MQNEIIIATDGTRTIIGSLAHKLAFEKNKATFFPLTKSERFHVFEHDGERWQHRAGQSTREGAMRYIDGNPPYYKNSDRVLVEFQGDSPFVERPFHNNEVRADHPRVQQFEDAGGPQTTPNEREALTMRQGCKILVETIYGATRALITGWRWSWTSVDPVSVLLFFDDGTTMPYTFATFTGFKQAFRGKYSS